MRSGRIYPPSRVTCCRHAIPGQELAREATRQRRLRSSAALNRTTGAAKGLPRRRADSLGPPRRAGCLNACNGGDSCEGAAWGARGCPDHGRRAGSTGKTPTTYMSKDGYALPIKSQKYEASGLRHTCEGLYPPEPKNIETRQGVVTFKAPRRRRTVEKQSATSATDAKTRRLSTSHKPVKWYEQKSFSRSQKYTTREVRRRALSETHPVPLMGQHTPFPRCSVRAGAHTNSS